MKIIQRIKYLLAATLLGTALLGSAPLAFAASQSQADACAGLSQLDTSSNCNTDSSGGISHLISVVINILSIIVGFIAVIMLIVGGLRFITSGGEASNTASARNTILYALVGVVIVALAQALVHFVIAKT
jgi:hypothetical protein